MGLDILSISTRLPVGNEQTRRYKRTKLLQHPMRGVENTLENVGRKVTSFFRLYNIALSYRPLVGFIVSKFTLTGILSDVTEKVIFEKV